MEADAALMQGKGKRAIYNLSYEVIISISECSGSGEAAAVAVSSSVSPSSAADPCPSWCDDMWEGCCSVPLARGLVRRPLRILARWQDKSGAAHEEQLSNWCARLWNDHLDGTLYDCAKAERCARKVNFSSQHEADMFKQELDRERQAQCCFDNLSC